VLLELSFTLIGTYENPALCQLGASVRPVESRLFRRFTSSDCYPPPVWKPRRTTNDLACPVDFLEFRRLNERDRGRDKTAVEASGKRTVSARKIVHVELLPKIYVTKNIRYLK
jgi:hypothetical protein